MRCTLQALDRTAAAEAGPLPPSAACQRENSYQTCMRVGNVPLKIRIHTVSFVI